MKPLTQDEWAHALKLIIETAGLGFDEDNGGMVSYAYNEYASCIAKGSYETFLVRQAFDEAKAVKL